MTFYPPLLQKDLMKLIKGEKPMNLQPGDKIITVCNLDNWEPGYRLFRAETVQEFQSAILHSDRVYTVSQKYFHEWFTNKEDAKKKVKEYIREQRGRLDEMEAELND